MSGEPIEGNDKQGRRIVISSNGSPTGNALIELLRKHLRNLGGESGGVGNR